MSKANRSKRVFINCPYDVTHKPVFDQVLFTIHDCGFQAVFAAQDVGGSVRITRIVELLLSCQYSIHVLSGVQLSGRFRVPRFNMPFEAGIAYAMKHLDGRRHDLLLLDSKPYRYQASLSDAAGLDIKIYNRNKPVISCVRHFLATHTDLPLSTYGGEKLIKRYKLFRSHLLKLLPDLGISLSEIEKWDYANDLQALMTLFIEENK